MQVDHDAVKTMEQELDPQIRARLEQAAEMVIKAKKKGGKVVAVLGSGPNIHEGITTLVAELIYKGVIDGVSTSSAVIAHEMAGTLEKVKRVDGESLGFAKDKLPLDGKMEVSLLSDRQFKQYQEELVLDEGLFRRMKEADGNEIIKVAGNMAYPTGFRTERLAREVLALAKRCGRPFEEIAGLGADPYTMIGAGARMGVPVLVTVPQLIGGGEVGLAIGDAISVSNRCDRLARLLADSDVIIESAVALTQEIHDGPYELYTGHGIWADWQGEWTYSLRDKNIIRIDLDPNLEGAWLKERQSGDVSTAIDKGLPKTVSMKTPFRMEMSGFARIPGSLPVIGDIGMVWPVMVSKIAEALNIKPELMSYKQSLEAGKKFREWIVENVSPLDRQRMLSAIY
ncbi:MAG: hypothetical protein K9J85_06720 [Desulfobacteraceae bacterium]|nr:hypothetical protein [Desulfobacteraceae bacterium]